MQVIYPLLLPLGHWDTMDWDRLGGTDSEIAAVHPHPPIWVEEYRIFEPCTIMMYCWEELLLYAPRLTGAGIPAAFSQNLRNGPMTPSQSRGFYFADLVTVCTGAPHLLPQ